MTGVLPSLLYALASKDIPITYTSDSSRSPLPCGDHGKPRSRWPGQFAAVPQGPGQQARDVGVDLQFLLGHFDRVVALRLLA